MGSRQSRLYWVEQQANCTPSQYLRRNGEKSPLSYLSESGCQKPNRTYCDNPSTARQSAVGHGPWPTLARPLHSFARSRNSENSKGNRIETMKGPTESGQICSGGRRKIAKNKRCYANTLRRRSRMLLKVMKRVRGGHYPPGSKITPVNEGGGGPPLRDHL
jgi:hypothetical protein